MSERYQLVRDSDVLNFTFDWSTFYLPSGETIVSRQWSISPALATFDNTTSATVHVGGFIGGRVYRLQEVVEISNGETAEQHIDLRCEQ